MFLMEGGIMKRVKCNTILFYSFFLIIYLIFSSLTAFAARADVEAFVTRFYQQCLGRNPDTPGLNGWVDALINGTLCGADVANGFIFSEEFINRNTSNEEFVTILYRAFFGREPDTPGYNGHVNGLYNGVSRQAILNGFINSQEFTNLCATYGINSSSSGGSDSGGTGQAIITSDNALDFIRGTYGMNQSGAAINPLRSVYLDDGNKSLQPNPVTLVQFVKKIIETGMNSEKEYRSRYKAVYTESGTVLGACGGRAYIALSISDITGNFSGTMTFYQYCESGVTLSGSMGLSGQVSIYTGDILKMTLTFNNLTGTSYAESATLSGSITADVTGTPAYMVMNFAERDNYTGKTYRAENFTIAIWDYGSYGEFSISGKFYDPDYGYITISTPLNFVILSYNTYPHQGELVVYGGNGTKARLRIISSYYCTVEADTDGNGTYDWSSGTLKWSEL